MNQRCKAANRLGILCRDGHWPLASPTTQRSSWIGHVPKKVYYLGLKSIRWRFSSGVCSRHKWVILSSATRYAVYKPDTKIPSLPSFTVMSTMMNMEIRRQKYCRNVTVSFDLSAKVNKNIVQSNLDGVQRPWPVHWPVSGCTVTPTPLKNVGWRFGLWKCPL